MSDRDMPVATVCDFFLAHACLQKEDTYQNIMDDKISYEGKIFFKWYSRSKPKLSENKKCKNILFFKEEHL